MLPMRESFMRRLIAILSVSLLTLSGLATADPHPGLPLPTPDWKQLGGTRLHSCTQPFYPEIAQILYNKPGTEESFGELIIYYETTPAGELKDPIISMVFEPDSDRGLSVIYVVLNTGKVHRFATIEDLQLVFPRPCDVYQSRHPGVPA